MKNVCILCSKEEWKEGLAWRIKNALIGKNLRLKIGKMTKRIGKMTIMSEETDNYCLLLLVWG
jgi:hypothetical protein